MTRQRNSRRATNRRGRRPAPTGAVEVGPRVYLREPVPADCSEVLARNRASARLYRGVATPMRTRTQFATYLARCEGRDYKGLLVCRCEDDAIVGSFNLSQIVRGGFQSACLGYQVFVPFDGQRYMTDAMPLVMHHLFAGLKLHRVEANIQPDNLASLALVKRAGFQREGYSPRYLKIAGRWRDHERWTMLVEEWKAAGKRPTVRRQAGRMAQGKKAAGRR